MSDRLNQIQAWLNDLGEYPDFTIESASDDASFRRYFRIAFEGKVRIVMDAPPDKEDSHPFVKIAQMLEEHGLNVPHVEQANYEDGFFVLSDLGDRQYLSELNERSAEKLYADALDALLSIQTCVAPELPLYDHDLLMQEMELFREWYLQKGQGIELSSSQNKTLDAMFDLLAEIALEQPQVCVHRDYHSRNLMLVDKDNPGILDFQDAVIGPITYDLVSLLRDAYIEWPREQVEGWAWAYCDSAVQSGLLTSEQKPHFLRWFDLMGVQRQLKVLGIFTRLNLRDGKARYLDDIPLVMKYIKDVVPRYPELSPLLEFLT